VEARHAFPKCLWRCGRGRVCGSTTREHMCIHGCTEGGYTCVPSKNL
jgi:hypothetical protein